MDNSPSLPFHADQSPMLGGDRRPIPCPDCGELMIRDFFGNTVCMPCSQNKVELKKIEETCTCSRCGAVEMLFVELDEKMRILGVFCEECCTWIWFAGFSVKPGIVWGTGYLTPHGIEIDEEGMY